MSKAPHIADAEPAFVVLNIAPDFCVIEGKVVPFDIARDLAPEKLAYAKTVHARGEPVLMVGSVVDGVLGNAGAGFFSGVSLAAGQVTMMTGAPSVLVEGRAVCRHGDLCWMNGK